jgi:predicted NACHT family NTPase
MADRSLSATPEGIKQAEIALTGMQLNQTTLATRLGCTRQPIGKFFRGEAVSNEVFVQICEVLKLDWQTIAGVVRPKPPILGALRLVQVARLPQDWGLGGFQKLTR